MHLPPITSLSHGPAIIVAPQVTGNIIKMLHIDHYEAAGLYSTQSGLYNMHMHASFAKKSSS